MMEKSAKSLSKTPAELGFKGLAMRMSMRERRTSHTYLIAELTVPHTSRRSSTCAIEAQANTDRGGHPFPKMTYARGRRAAW